jgi:hypothetical protein
MLTLGLTGRIWVCVEPQDGRKSFDGLAAAVTAHLSRDPLGGLRPTAVLLSVAASVKRHGVNPWAYLTHVLTELPARRPGADLTDLLPDEWTCAQAGVLMGAG